MLSRSHSLRRGTEGGHAKRPTLKSCTHPASDRTVNSYLKDNLTGYQKMEPQGSYALETLDPVRLSEMVDKFGRGWG